MTPEQAHSGYRTVAGDACPGVCHLWSHRTDRTDPALSTCAYCGAVEGSPAGLCATMTTAIWVKKAWQEWRKGCTVVLLIPSRTDTRWWHDYVMGATEIRFIKGRLKFDNATTGAPFPSCVVVWRAAQSALQP